MAFCEICDEKVEDNDFIICDGCDRIVCLECSDDESHLCEDCLLKREKEKHKVLK